MKQLSHSLERSSGQAASHCDRIVRESALTLLVVLRRTAAERDSDDEDAATGTHADGDSDDDAVEGEATLRLHTQAAAAAGRALHSSEANASLLAQVDDLMPLDGQAETH